MSVVVENTPNPRAMKFTMGVPVGGPATYTDATAADPRVAAVFSVSGVQSLFMTGDFVTVTRSDDGNWETIVPQVVAILEESFT
ncbi:MAG: NifU N-terminal domain-containing protein [Actinomycetia bacterium]|nr:NifU N-terminal domain-containing protein [Actinomycetes bacterium]